MAAVLIGPTTKINNNNNNNNILLYINYIIGPKIIILSIRLRIIHKI
jgi:hypothetical protein